MNPDQARALGTFLRGRRQELGLSTTQLGEAAEVNQATIVRLEQGKFVAPAPDTLARVARALKVSSSEVFALADYVGSEDLPSFKPYLRTKYRDLPTGEIEAIEKYAARLAKKHGIRLDGPAPGEDEA